jgi:hypothetical protein
VAGDDRANTMLGDRKIEASSRKTDSDTKSAMLRKRSKLIQTAVLLAAIALPGAAFVADARADLSVNVVNKSGGDPSQVFIMFGNTRP